HLALTAEGLRFYEHCAALLRAAGEAEDAVAGAGTAVRGVLRVSAPVTFAQMHLARAIAAFLPLHPGVEVHLATDDRLVDVVEGDFDVVVRITRLREGDFVARRIAVDRLVVVGAPSYLARAGRPETPADLAAHNCMHYALVPAAAEWRFRGAG